jgi:hypothetical protein
MYKFFILLFLSICIYSQNENSQKREFKYAVGLGFEYAILGIQLSYKSNVDNFFISVGYPAVSIGYQKTVSTNLKHALGISATRIDAIFSSAINVTTLSYNYFVDRFSSSGLSYGLSIAYSTGFNNNQEFRPSFQIGVNF